MNTEAMLKGTFIINNCYWDGGTCFYYGINYMVIDCQDYGKKTKTSKIILLVKKYENDLVK